jgi:dynein heavy chain
MEEFNIPISSKFNFIKTMGDPVLIRDWMLHGLPSDIVSQENSLFTTKGYRFPLLIDPQL